ncbi:LysR family transcriptional regulator [Thiomonas sp. FB-6]|uniref:LysR family transcriptional regulator n=1 Tax=Thiomonas sp. FB-6 TaxID=1158291 RepID=UPI00036E9209|nr:LysR family transcriptional regulator [Thiomonas sp. FB-6]
MIDLEACRVFARVVDEHSFSAAARSLGMSLPAVSKHVARLERELEARLLHRTTRRLSLTEAGTVFHGHCLRLLEDARAAQEGVLHLHDAPRGELRLSAPVSFAATELAPLLPGFLARYPEISLDIDASDRQVDLADEGFDLAIRLTERPPEGLVARTLHGLRRVVCASPEYLRRAGVPTHPAELAHHDCLTYPQFEGATRWDFERAGERVEIVVRGRLRSNHSELLLRSGRQGLGLLRVRDYTVREDLQRGSLREVLGDWAPDTAAGIHLLYLPNRRLPPKARVFIDYLLQVYRGAEAGV